MKSEDFMIQLAKREVAQAKFDARRYDLEAEVAMSKATQARENAILHQDELTELEAARES